MYFPESEATAASYTGLTSLVKLIDAEIAKGGVHATLNPDVLAAMGSVGRQQVIAVLQGYQSTFVGQEMVECLNDNCGQHVPLSNGRRPDQCTQCEGRKFRKNTKLLFRLSEAGKAMVRRRAGGLDAVHLPETIADYRGKVDAVILTIKSEEFAAVLKRAPGSKTVTGRRHYNVVLVDSAIKGTAHLVAMVRQIEQGTGEAQNAVRDAIDDLDPALILVVGIAGAMPSGDLTLGDVVFANHVYDLTLSAKSPDKTTYDVKGGPMLKPLQAELANLQVSLPSAVKLGTLPQKPRIDFDKLILPSDEKVRDDILRPMKVRHGGDSLQANPTFRDGAIASSDQLVKDLSVWEQWKPMIRKCCAVEMETAGAYRASRTTTKEYPVLSVRSMSDVVGLPRSEDWTDYACEVAAEYAFAFLRTRTATPK